MSSRDAILNRLREAQQPFTDIPPLTERRRMVPLDDLSPAALLERFMQEAQKLNCLVQADAPAAVTDQIIALIGEDRMILSSDLAHVPLPMLGAALDSRGIRISPDPTADGVRVGITGADALLAGTGSLVVCSGAGKPRATSLLPDIHIAIVKASQMVADFETWSAQQKSSGHSAYRAPANTIVISGPSKTADIAQELIKGAHGPRVLHIFIVP
jgi:L-lactate dehydrogenase complex protein LldG